MVKENVKIEEVSNFLKNGKVYEILNVLDRYSDERVDFTGESIKAIMVLPQYLEITKDEVRHWGSKEFHLSCDSDLLIDFIYRIPFIDENDYKKLGKVETIVDNLLQKVNSIKNN
jgi:hypothetical protein